MLKYVSSACKREVMTRVSSLNESQRGDVCCNDIRVKTVMSWWLGETLSIKTETWALWCEKRGALAKECLSKNMNSLTQSSVIRRWSYKRSGQNVFRDFNSPYILSVSAQGKLLWRACVLTLSSVQYFVISAFFLSNINLFNWIFFSKETNVCFAFKFWMSFLIFPQEGAVRLA